ncbi:hypothetical protein O6H91_13G104800 [Diphasiastrum complanatum]|uniref:Uncharacterized protein n=1 Tax=Diphasiastrum complanatum TaxID=34168 RepID=A0ACC2BY23_DIPCM|nr:hypothetical protein O6H91_13G104800 [Diphasiastrum complanatum]
MGADPSSDPASSSDQEFLSAEEDDEEDDEKLTQAAASSEDAVPIEQDLFPWSASSVILTPPLSIDKNPSTTDQKQKSILFRVLDLLKAVRPGSDLTKFRVPPQFNLPKSQLQLYGESIYCCGHGLDLLAMCTQGATPLERFVAVVRWHISTSRPAPFGKAPYNPILGETHHVSFGKFNLIAEQVSHHPPVTAIHVTDEMKKLRMTWWHEPAPHFYGNGIEVTIRGRRILSLLEFGEDYELTSPKLNIRFFPMPGTDWDGNTSVSCQQTGLKATISFKGKGLLGLRGGQRKISGKIWDSSGKTLYELRGSWDNVVNLIDRELEKTNELYDGRAALTEMEIPVIQNTQDISPLESVYIWSSLTKSILEMDWEKARTTKAKIEECQRVLRRQREKSGRTWSPNYFRQNSNGDWEWLHSGKLVNLAPIVVP